MLVKIDRSSGAELRLILSGMESLGGDCEFGAVQQAAGVDRLGLFRWSSVSLSKIVLLLKQRFDHLDDLNELDVYLGAGGEAYLRNKHRHFTCHCGSPPTSNTGRDLHTEWARLRLLKRKMIADLTTGDRLFVYKGPGEEGGVDVAALASAVRAYGPGQVLWVSVADEPRRVGKVKRLGPGLIRGFVDRFAPPEDGLNASLSAWFAVARRAHRLKARPEVAAWVQAPLRALPLSRARRVLGGGVSLRRG